MTCQQDEIVEGWEREMSASQVCGGGSQHFDVGATDCGIIVAHSYAWNGNVTFLILITWLKGLLLDVWPTLPPEASLKETELMRRNSCGSISYFAKWA